MNTIQTAYINALLADASYVRLQVGAENSPPTGTLVTDPVLLNARLSSRLTQPQANYLLANFDILTQTLSPTGGFDAVVWKGKSGTDYAGQIYVSMRGTQGATDFDDDLSLASRGIPYEQIRDMANWWMRATAKPGDVVKQVKITATGNLAQVFTFTQDSTAVATGELYGQVAQIAGVNGHSLGGYLATAFTRLFGAKVGHVNTFNSAGFSDAAGTNIKAEFDKLESLLGTSAMGTGSFEAAGAKQTNYRAGNGVNVASNNWGEMPYWAVGFNQYGQKVSLYQEDTLGWNPFANHSLYKQTDYLALGAALETLSPSLTFATLNDLIKTGSNDMKASYEGVLDAMRQLGSATRITDTQLGDAGDNAASRADFHTKLAALQANTTFKSLAGKLSFSTAAASATSAKTDFAQFLSLYDLSPFSMSVSDAAAKTALLNARSDVAAKWQALAYNFSDKWLADRSAMQSWMLQANTADNQGVITGQPQNSNAYFEDAASGKTIKVGTVSVTQMRNFKFGDAAASSLTGGGLNDALYGGDGNDTLDGLGSPDWLEGGKGLDTYRAGAADKIVDIDGKGVVYMDGVLLSGGSRNKGEDWFVSADGTTRYREIGKLILVVKGGQTLNIDGTLQASSKLANGDTISGQQGLGISLITKGGDSDSGNDASGIGDTTGTTGATGTVMPRRDPLVLDLDGDGIETRGRSETLVLFDHDGDGIKTGTGWIRPDDGWLVRDINGNGQIDSGLELFGVDTDKSNGSKASDGFDALADLDSNADGLIDSKDDAFSSLKVWQDSNQDGTSQAEEIKSLSDLGIVSIGVQSQSVSNDLGNGNLQTAKGSFTKSNGQVGSTGETNSAAANLDLLVNTFYRTFNTSVTLSEEAQSLPEMRGSGRVRDLREAMSLSTELTQTVRDYAQQTDKAGQVALLDTLVHRWAKTSDMRSLQEQAIALSSSGVSVTYQLAGLSAGSDGFNDFVDQLGVVERFMGFTYAGANGQARYSALTAGAGSLTVSLATEQVNAIMQTYQMIKTDVYQSLLLQTRLKLILNELTAKSVGTGESADWQLDWSGVEQTLTDAITNDPRQGIEDLADFVSALQRNGLSKHWSHMKDFMVGSLLSVTEVDLPGLSLNTDNGLLTFANNEQTQFTGSLNADILFGSKNNDQLYGGNGNDTLKGGKGNDNLYGGNYSFNRYGYGDGYGNDTYIFNQGDGADNIYDDDYSQGNSDTLKLGAGLLASATLVSNSGSDLKLTWGADSVTVQYYFAGASRRIENIEFTDGTKWTESDLAAKLQVFNGSSGTDYLYGWANFANTINGLAGSDYVYGGDKDDKLDGGEGNDSLYGNNGNDILTGGTDNDYLNGSYGNDTYIFNQGDGADTIYDGDSTNGNIDTLKLGVGLTAAAAVVTISENDVTLTWGTDSVTFKNCLYIWFYEIENIEFADGTQWRFSDLMAHVVYQGTNSSEFLYGLSDYVNNMNGLAGNDTLRGGDKDDKLDGGEGNDSLYGNNGNDILTGGTDNDYLYGGNGHYLEDGNGNDTYIFNQGDGADTIYDNDYKAGNVDKLKLGAGLLASAVVVSNSGSDIKLTWGTDSVTVQNYITGISYRVENIEFADGTKWTASDLAARLQIQNGTPASDNLSGWSEFANTLNGLAGNDTLRGGDKDDHLDGGEGNDYLYGSGGNDTLTGGTGNDSMYGGNSNDTYIFNQGDGADTISDDDSTPGNTDTLKLGAGLLASAVVVSKSGNDLKLTWGTDSVTVQNYFTGISYRVENIEFADGTKWTASDLAARLQIQNGTPASDNLSGWSEFANTLNGLAGNDTLRGGDKDDHLDGGEGNDSLYGDSGNDTLTGGTGNDYIYGGNSNDTYIFNQGDGADTISDDDSTPGNTDTLKLGAGLLASAVVVSKSGNDLKLTWGTDSVTVQNYFTGISYRVENIEFADGTKWTANDLAANLIQYGTAAADYLSGLYEFANNIKGLAGNDTLTGGSKDDKLDGGEGNDVLYGDILYDDIGNDTLTGGTGNDYLYGGSRYSGGYGKGNDTYIFNQGDGADTISDDDSTPGNTDTLKLGGGLLASATVVSNSGSDLKLTWGADSVTVQYYFAGASRRIENIEFTDGTKWTESDLAAKLQVFNGSSGTDYLYGWANFANTINGLAGSDTLRGGDKDDKLDGGEGNDSLYGNNGNDILTGGTDNDYLNGSYGNDTYIFNQGDGADTIYDYDSASGNSDTLKLGAGLLVSAVVVSKSGDDIKLTWGADSVTVQNYFFTSYRIENIEFADGTKWTASDLAANLIQYGTVAADYLSGLYEFANDIKGLAGNDTLTGGSKDDKLDGGEGNDVLYGDSNWYSFGNDTLTGGTGNDFLYGGNNDNYGYGNGNDTYIFNQGDGADTISDDDSTLGNTDTLKLGAGLLASAVVVSKSGNDLKLTWGADSVTVQDYFAGTNYRIENIEFADGTKWTVSDLAARLPLPNGTPASDNLSGWSEFANTLNGLAGNDTLTGGDKDDKLDGGEGNDSLNGGIGNDTYIFNQGDGADTIYDYDYTAGNKDILKLGAGLLASAVVASKNGNDLKLTWGTDSVTLQNYFSTSYRIENVEFADGTKWTVNELVARLPTLSGTNASDKLSGWSEFANTLNGLAGNDTLIGGDKDDHLDGGEGNDYLYGLGGNDTLTGGTGNDFLYGGNNYNYGYGNGNDTYIFNQGDGADTISDDDSTLGNTDTLKLGAGLLASAVVVSKSGNDLKLTWGTDSVTVQDYFAGTNYRIENIEFADGTKWTASDLAAKVPLPNGTPASDNLSGWSEFASTLNGLAGNDTLTGGMVNDSLTGGLGADLLVGGDGSDTYIFNSGDGADVIDDLDADSARYISRNFNPYQQNTLDTDKLLLGEGLTVASTILNRSGDNLVLSWTGNNNDSITIKNYFVPVSNSYSTWYAQRIESIEFAEGAKWGFKDINNRLLLTQPGTTQNDSLKGVMGSRHQLDGQQGDDTLQGGNLDDTLTGGLGADSLAGGDGSDTYVFNLGDGADVIEDLDADSASYLSKGWLPTSITYFLGANNPDVPSTLEDKDRLVLGEGLTPTNTLLTRNGNDLIIEWRQNAFDSIKIKQYFEATTILAGTAYTKRIESIEFADGTKWGVTDVTSRAQQVINGTTAADNLSGLSGFANRINGFAGNDILRGGYSDDKLDGGEGNDSLYGGSGNDTLTGGTGNDYLDGSYGGDTYIFNQGDGADTISDEDSTLGNTDTLKLGSGLLASTVVASKSGNDLKLTWGTDSVTVQNYFAGTSYRVENIEFSDGTKWTASDLAAKVPLPNGTPASDNLSGWSEFANTLNGLAGNDTLTGGDKDDKLDGGEGNDSLYGNNGNDILTGGTDNDYLNGSYGNDTYIFNQGDGDDTIYDYDYTAGNKDILKLGAGLLASAVVVSNSGSDIKLTWGTDSVTVQDYFAGFRNRIENIEFADGTKWTASDLAARLQIQNGTPASDNLSGWIEFANTLNGLAGNDTLRGGDKDDKLDGGEGNDYLYGSGGNDTLTGGTGNDYLYGGNGHYLEDGNSNESYIFNQGDGADTIYDNDYKAGNVDTLKLGAGLLASTMVASKSDNDLKLTWGADSVTVKNYFAGTYYRIETIEFSDGTKWTVADLAARLPLPNGTPASDNLSGWSEFANTLNGLAGNDTLTGGDKDDKLDGGEGNDSLYGNNGNDILTGGTGNDYLYGGDRSYSTNLGNGNDTYIFNQGDGTDTIYDVDFTVGNLDTLKLGAGLLASTVVASKSDNDLKLTWGADSVTVQNYFIGISYRVENIQFADGTKWGVIDVIDRAKQIHNGTAAADNLSGLSNIINCINGLAGNDTLRGGAKADTLTGGLGADTVAGGDGSDSYVFNQGDGAEVINDSDADSAYYVSQGWNPGWYSAQDTDHLVLGAGLTAATTLLSRSGDDLVLKWSGNTTDSITVKNYFTASSNYYGTWYTQRLESIEFADGTVWGVAEIAQQQNGTATADNFVGFNDFANRIYGLEGDDTLMGGGGNDELQGGSGSDTYVFNLGDGYDEIVEDPTDITSTDTLQLGSGLLASQISLNKLGQDLILSWGSSDTLVLVDQFLPLSKSQIERVVFADGTVWESQWLTAKALGAQFGTTGSDTLIGKQTHDALMGAEGKDYIEGGKGNDSLFGGDGNDVLDEDGHAVKLGYGDDLLDGGAGNDTLFSGDGTDTLLGGIGNDVMYGEYGNDWLFGGGENDYMEGGTGNDTLLGGDGNDVLDEDGHGVKLGYGDDLLDGGAGNDTLFSGDGTDTLLGGIGNDVMYGEYGNDWLFGGGENDYMEGGTGNDTLLGGDGNDVLDEDGHGVKLGYGDDLLDGGDGNDTLFSGDGTDTLLGGIGKDVMYGENGNDMLDGGMGNDTLTGGAGSDQFVFDALTQISGNADTITDFSANQSDKIVLSSAVFTSLFGKSELSANIRNYSAPSVGGDDFIVYDSGNGNLYYDPTGLSNANAVLIANLQNKPLTMAANQFVVL